MAATGAEGGRGKERRAERREGGKEDKGDVSFVTVEWVVELGAFEDW